MEYLYKNGYRVISLDEIADYMNNNDTKRQHKILALTFDDGYKSIYESAMPILQKFDFTATVFLPTKYIGKYSKWINRSVPLLTWNEILTMEKKGILFGSHGHSHQDLTVLTEERARKELEISKKILEEKLKRPVAYISYPYSKSNEIIEDMALKCGYRTSFSGISIEKLKVQRMQKNNFIALRRFVIKKDNILSFKFLLAETYHYYFDLKRLLGFRNADS
jgi:peptidoglycan/xylan/chitin deacetylase (PgdA/CDA1 family)